MGGGVGCHPLWSVKRVRRVKAHSGSAKERGTLLFAPRKDSGMKGIIGLIVLMLSPEVPLLAQETPNGVSRSVDTFTGDTVWETKYGRLDDPHGCSRAALAIIWKLVRGPSGRTEWLTLSMPPVSVPRAMINVDGR